MSLMELHMVRVRCDGCGKLAGHVKDSRPNARSARTRARQLGFTRKIGYDKNYDLCSDCDLSIPTPERKTP